MANYLGVEPTKEDKYYFISYNSEDTNRLRPYAERLAQAGLPFWYDHGIRAGEEWREVIALKIRACEAVIMFLSKSLLNKKESFVIREYETAKRHKRPLFFIFLDDIDETEIPPKYDLLWGSILERQCISFYDCSVEEGVKKLLYELNISSPSLEKKKADLPLSTNAATNTPSNESDNSITTVTERNGYFYVKNIPYTGKGTVNISSKGTYTGDFSKGRLHGKGRFVSSDGDVYEGDFRFNEAEGYGKFISHRGLVYEGGYHKNKRHGAGTLKMRNGDVYVGNFRYGEMDGFGTRTNANGNVQDGVFRRNKFLT